MTNELFSVLDNDGSGTNQDNRIDIRDLSASEDGQQFLVSIRAPELPEADENEQPKWNIWHYAQSTKKLERLIIDDNLAERAGRDHLVCLIKDLDIVARHRSCDTTRQRREARAPLLEISQVA